MVPIPGEDIITEGKIQVSEPSGSEGNEEAKKPGKAQLRAERRLKQVQSNFFN